MSQETFIPKIISPADQPELFIAVGGRFRELIQGRVKAASEVITKEVIERFKPPKTHFMARYIGVGAHSRFGFNKNADAWTDEVLARYTPTFVSHGHYFQEHNNKDPRHKIGDIKFAAFNPATGWSEILVWGDKSKAERQYEMIKAGKALAGSMACRIDSDVCNSCGNVAKTRANYCMDMLSAPGQYNHEKRAYNFVWNPRPTFIDYSDVLNPAERVARQLGVWLPEGDGLAKVASEIDESRFVSASDIRELSGLGNELRELATIEERFEKEALAGFPARDGFGKLAAFWALPLARKQVRSELFRKLATYQMPSVTRLLARNRVILGPDDFGGWLGCDVKTAGLRTAYRDMLKRGCGCMGLLPDFMSGGDRLLESEPDHWTAIDRMMEEIATDVGLGATPEAAEQQTPVIQIRITKTASASELPVEAYALHKLATVFDIVSDATDHLDPLLPHILAVAKNFV